MEWGWKAAPPGIRPSETKATKFCCTKDPRRISKHSFILERSYIKSVKAEPDCQNKKLNTNHKDQETAWANHNRNKKTKNKTQFRKTGETPTYGGGGRLLMQHLGDELFLQLLSMQVFFDC